MTPNFHPILSDNIDPKPIWLHLCHRPLTPSFSHFSPGTHKTPRQLHLSNRIPLSQSLPQDPPNSSHFTSATDPVAPKLQPPLICPHHPQPLLPSPLPRRARGLPTFRHGEPSPRPGPLGLGLGQLARRLPLSGSPSLPPRGLPRAPSLASPSWPLSPPFLRAPSFSLFLSSPIPLSQAPSLRRPLSCASRWTHRPARPQPRAGSGPRAGPFRRDRGLGKGLGGGEGAGRRGRGGGRGRGGRGARDRAGAGCARRARAAGRSRAEGRAGRGARRRGGGGRRGPGHSGRPEGGGEPGEVGSRAGIGVCSGGRRAIGARRGKGGMGAALRGGRGRRRRRRGGD